MYPHTGRYRVSGRIGALLEVRAGLHGDLTGRENIYLYGGLLGLTKADVARRFDEIVEFAVLSSAIDRQVKFYSSGMQMRLGFAVAAFLDPDVMLVDEVLAVGDAWFQQRCLDKLRDILSGGCTLVFVSHDLAAVEASCRRAILPGGAWVPRIRSPTRPRAAWRRRPRRGGPCDHRRRPESPRRRRPRRPRRRRAWRPRRRTRPAATATSCSCRA